MSPAKASAIAVAFLLLPLALSAKPARDFKVVFASDYAEAMAKVPEYDRLLRQKLGGDALWAAVGMAMVFPEMVRYSYIRDVAETSFLQVSYVLGMKADFSIGPFQMKCSFAEALEREISEGIRGRHSLDYGQESDAQAIRSARLRRLRDAEGQLDYLAALIEHLRERYPDIAAYPLRAARFFAEAYNTGFWKDDETIALSSGNFSFPYGKNGGSDQYSYAEIALTFFLENAPLLEVADVLPRSAATSYGLTERESAAAVASLARSGLSYPQASAVSSILRQAARGYLPPGLSLDEMQKETVCAKAVSRSFWSVFGDEDTPSRARGVSGDAWMMSSNVRSFGGSVAPWTAEGRSTLEPGDILGLRYSLSLYNSLEKPVDYTHVALVLAVPELSSPIILHCWKTPEFLAPSPPWPLRVEKLDSFLSDFAGLFEVKEIIRPRNRY